MSTDAEGAYKIVDLRPGTYVITFTLQGFTTFKRDGVELPSNFTATIDGEMKVGALEESVTVSGQSPVVDVQTNVKSQVLPRDVVDAAQERQQHRLPVERLERAARKLSRQIQHHGRGVVRDRHAQRQGRRPGRVGTISAVELRERGSLPGLQRRLASSFTAKLDLFNALDADYYTSVASTQFNAATYLQPSVILQGRIIRAGVDVKW